MKKGISSLGEKIDMERGKERKKGERKNREGN